MLSYADRNLIYTYFMEWAEEQGIEVTISNLLSFMEIYQLFNEKNVFRFIHSWPMLKDVYPEE